MTSCAPATPLAASPHRALRSIRPTPGPPWTGRAGTACACSRTPPRQSHPWSLVRPPCARRDAGRRRTPDRDQLPAGVRAWEWIASMALNATMKEDEKDGEPPDEVADPDAVSLRPGSVRVVGRVALLEVPALRARTASAITPRGDPGTPVMDAVPAAATRAWARCCGIRWRTPG